MGKEEYNVLIAAGKATMDHDPRVNEWLRTLLESCGRFNVTVNEDFRGATPELLKNYDAVLINYLEMKMGDRVFRGWGENAENALADFVRSGKGVIFYHGSVLYDHDNDNTVIRKMIGVDFNSGRGFRKSPFVPAAILPEADIQVVATVFDSVEDYVPDKMQKHVLDTFDTREFEKLPNINQNTPVVWTNSYGDGRVFCVSIGHGPDTIRRPPFVAMMCRGVEWVCSGEATIAPPDLQYDNRFRTWPYYLPVTYHDIARMMQF